MRGLQLPYKEFVTNAGDSPNESLSADGTTSVRTLDVAWDTRFLAYAQLLGYSALDKTNPAQWKLSRYLPDYLPSSPVLIATEITGTKGLGPRGYQTIGGRKEARYEKCRLTVKYTFPEYDVLEDAELPMTDPCGGSGSGSGSGSGAGGGGILGPIRDEFVRYRTFRAKPSAEYLSPPAGALMKWSSGPAARENFPGNVGLIVGTIEYHWAWLQVPFEGVPSETIQDIVGKVNMCPFAGCDAGTLLLLGHELTRVNSPQQYRTWTVEYIALFKKTGHNYFYDYRSDKPGQRGWHQASVDGVFYTEGSVPDGKLLFDERDFQKLFDVNSD